MKLKIFKKTEKNFRKGGFHINPDICWEVIIYVAFAVVVLFFIFSFYIFGQVDIENTPVSPAGNTQSQAIRKERIDKVLQYFSDREKNSTNILNSPTPLVDPSL